MTFRAGTIAPQVICVGISGVCRTKVSLPTSARNLKTRPPLTTIQQDFTRAGEALVAALIATIRSEPVRSVALPTRLVVRQSCGANAT